MDPLFAAHCAFRQRDFDSCISLCTDLLLKNPYDQAAWFLKTRSLTEQVYVDELDVDEEGLAETLLDENSVAQVARPGTSFKAVPRTSQGMPSQSVRPISQSGRPLSGFVRPGTQSGTRPGTMEQMIMTPRSAMTARPVTSASGRHVRLGTASLLSEPGGPFINISKLNLAKYAQRPHLANALFDYIFHHENDVRNALELAAKATEAVRFQDWLWKVQLGKCYYRLGMYRDASQQFLSALRHQEMVDTVLYLCKVYNKLDQPLKAIDLCKKFLEKFPNDATLIIALARIYEGIGEVVSSVSQYKEVLKYDSTNVEAIACIANHHFYTDMPEIALRYYRRLLQMGVYNAELFNNLGLCCFYSQQYDMALNCFIRSVELAEDDVIAEVWYNIGHVAVSIGDMSLAQQCFKLTMTLDNDHAEAYNNLAVLELRRGGIDQAQSLFQQSSKLNSCLYEPKFNGAAISEKVGDLQRSYVLAKQSTDAFPEHIDSTKLLKRVKEYFSAS